MTPPPIKTHEISDLCKQKLLLLGLFKDCVKASKRRLCIADICRFGLKVTYFLCLKLPHWSGARGRPASHPDRRTDLPPLLLAPCHQRGATSPLPAPLEKNTEKRELILLQEKKGPFIQEANCRPQWSRGEKNFKHPPELQLCLSIIFLCGKTEHFHVSLESYCFYKKGKTGTKSYCCLERIIITAETDSYFCSNLCICPQYRVRKCNSLYSWLRADVISVFWLNSFTFT